MKSSESIAKVAEAIARAQSNLKKAVKDSTNPHFKSRYADLESILDAMREPFAKEQLAVVQSISGGEISTRIAHASGEWLETSLPVHIAENATAQQIGSAVSYARRYALAMSCGIAQTDDDAEAAVGRVAAPVAAPVAAALPPPMRFEIRPYDADLDKDMVKSILFKAKVKNDWLQKHRDSLKAYLIEHGTNEPIQLQQTIQQYFDANKE